MGAGKNCLAITVAASIIAVMASTDTPLSDLPLPYVNNEGSEVLETRVKDVTGARSLYNKLRDADLKSNVEMAKVQAMADGEPPYSAAVLRASNQGYLSNFNPNDFKALLDTALAAYTDLISADETLIELHTTHGTIEERAQWSQIMSRNMSRVIRAWPRFFFQYAFIPHYFTLHGVGIAYFEDCYNWQWQVSNLAMVKIPRDTQACEDEIPYAFARAKTSPQNLLKYVLNEEYAKDEGWNIPALKKALMQVNTAGDTNSPTTDWLAFERYWKNNDITWGENSPQVNVIYGWIKENDGRISVYVFTETGLDNPNGEKEDFLCVKRFAYSNAQEAFVFFTRGIGTNGTYHAIRGLGSDIYNAMQALMRLENRKVDLAFACGPIFQVADEEKIESAMATPWGAFTLMTSGVNVVNVTPPNLQMSIDPAVTALRGTIQSNAGTYTSANALNSSREMTKAEVLSKLEQSATLSVTSINLFNQPMDRLAREIGRRFTREGYLRTDPGGDYVNNWILDCVRDGVPKEALHKVDHRRTKAARVIGFGSPAARRVALQMMMEMYQFLDEYGKAQLVRDMTAATVGWEKADVYTQPVDAAARPPIDAQIAELQNAALMAGTPQPVFPNENKRVHLEVHIGKISEYIAQFNEAGQNPELYAEIVPPMQSIYEHAAETLEGYTQPDGGEFRQALQQVGEIVVNGIRHMQKEEQRQMQMAEQEGQMGGGMDQATEEMRRRTIEWQVKLDQDIAEAEAKREQKALDAQQNRVLKDLDMRAKLLRDTISAQARGNTGSSFAA